IITNAGGCGSHLKHYSTLLANDPAYAKRAELWDTKVKDIHEWLINIGIRRPLPAVRRPPDRFGADNAQQRADLEIDDPVVVTYHESCHLTHGQKVVSQPRELLRAIPGLK